MYVKVVHLLDSQLVLKELVNKLCQLAYLEIRRTGSVQQYLSFEATKTPFFPLLFPLGLIVVMLSLLALFRFSFIE